MVSRASGVPPPLTPKGHATRARLLAAARQVFAWAGPVDAKVTDITRRAGVASGTFYRYFGSKEDIFRQVAAMTIDELTDAAWTVPDLDAANADVAIEQGIRRYLTAFRDNAALASAVETATSTDPVVWKLRRAGIRQGVQRAERLIRRLQDAGVADAAVDPGATAAALNGMVMQLALHNFVRLDGPAATEAAAATDLDLLVRTAKVIWVRAITGTEIDARFTFR